MEISKMKERLKEKHWREYYNRFTTSTDPTELAVRASREVKVAIVCGYGVEHFKGIINALDDVAEERGWDISEVIKNG